MSGCWKKRRRRPCTASAKPGGHCRPSGGCWCSPPTQSLSGAFGRSAEKKRKLYNGMLKCDAFFTTEAQDRARQRLKDRRDRRESPFHAHHFISISGGLAGQRSTPMPETGPDPAWPWRTLRRGPQTGLPVPADGPRPGGAALRASGRDGKTVRMYACGGDGTVHEAANGIAGFPNAAMTCIPAGTGNDLLKNFGPTMPPVPGRGKSVDGPASPGSHRLQRPPVSPSPAPASTPGLPTASIK